MKLIFSAVLGAVLLTACTPFANHQPNKQGVAMPTAQKIEKQKTVISRYNFDDTVQRLKTTFEQKSMTVFAVIDHKTSAEKAGLTMQPATVIVFGTPKAGTPLMVKDPAFALQLPLKVLVTEVNGQVQVVFTNTHALIQDSNIAYDDVKNTLANAEKLIEKTVTE